MTLRIAKKILKNHAAGLTQYNAQQVAKAKTIFGRYERHGVTEKPKKAKGAKLAAETEQTLAQAEAPADASAAVEPAGAAPQEVEAPAVAEAPAASQDEASEAAEEEKAEEEK